MSKCFIFYNFPRFSKTNYFWGILLFTIVNMSSHNYALSIFGTIDANEEFPSRVFGPGLWTIT